MKIKLIMFIMFFIIFCTSDAANLSAFGTENAVGVYIDGSKIEFADVRPEIKDGRIFVPIRFISEKMGYNVSYNAGEKTVSVANIFTHRYSTSFVIMSDGRTLDIGVASYVKSDRGMVSIRLFAEALGAMVGWDAICGNVIISTKYSASDKLLTSAHIHCGPEYLIYGGKLDSGGSDSIALVRDNGKMAVKSAELIIMESEASRDKDISRAALIAQNGAELSADNIIILSGIDSYAVVASGRGTKLEFDTVSVNSFGKPAFFVESDADLSARNLTVNSKNDSEAVFVSNATAQISNSKLSSQEAAIHTSGTLNGTRLTAYSSKSFPLIINGGTTTLKDCAISGLKGSILLESANQAVFSANGGSLSAENGSLIVSKDSEAKIQISNTEIFTSNLIFAENSKLNIFVENQDLTGDISLTNTELLLDLKNSSVFSGNIFHDKAEGMFNLKLDRSSRLNLKNDITVTLFEDRDDQFTNIISNGYNIFYDKEACPALGGLTHELPGGGTLTPR